jgi:hypothetical protein
MPIVGVGTQLASSFDGQHPDLDWALIEIQHPHHQSANVTSIDWITGQCQIYVEQLVPAIQETVSVLVITSLGAWTGFLSASPIYYKSPSTASFGEVYVVRLDGKLGTSRQDDDLRVILIDLESRDAGSWVIDPETGDLYGHIIAIFAEARIAYLVPVYRIFNDIKEQLGGTMELAGRKRSNLASIHQPGILGMNETDESVIRQMHISKEIFAQMAVSDPLLLRLYHADDIRSRQNQYTKH